MTLTRAQAADILFRNASSRSATEDELKDVFALGESASPTDGLALQLEVLGRWQAAGERLAGWKAGLTSLAARDRMGPGFRPFGYVLASRTFASGDRVPLSAIRAPKLETEICLTIGAPLKGADVSAGEARAAVSEASPSYEITEGRLPAPMPNMVNVANDLGQWGIVVGAPLPPGTDLATLEVSLRRDGELVDSGRSGPETLDDPYLSLARICGQLAPFGLGLEPGQRVITGAIVKFPPVDGPSTWTASFSGLSEVTAVFE